MHDKSLSSHGISCKLIIANDDDNERNYLHARQILHLFYYCGRKRPIEGFADDYAFVIRGLLDLFECSQEIQWLQLAERLQFRQDELFWDEEGGGYYNSQSKDPSIVIRMKEGRSLLKLKQIDVEFYMLYLFRQCQSMFLKYICCYGCCWLIRIMSVI